MNSTKSPIVRLLRPLTAAVLALAPASLMPVVAHADSTTLNFDSVSTTSEVDATSYFASFGISITNASGTVKIARATYLDPLVAPSSPNILEAPTGISANSFTLVLASAVTTVTFTRAGSPDNIGPVCIGSWSVSARDAAGQVVASASEPAAAMGALVAEKTFVLSGTGITSLAFTGGGRTACSGTRYGPYIDDLILSTDSPTATATSTAVPTATKTPTPTATNTTTPSATNTAVPTATSTAAPAATNTAVPTATSTSVPPTATSTTVPAATSTPVPPTATNTAIPPPAATAVQAGGSASAAGSASIAGGTLSLGTLSGVSFSGTLTGQNQVLSSPANALTVTDATGSGSGWRLTVSGTQLTTGGATPHTLSATALQIGSSSAAVTASAASGSTGVGPTNGVSYPVTVPLGSGVTASSFFNASSGTGMGKFDLNVPYFLAVPANTFAGSYSGTLTVSLVAGP